MSYHQRDEIRWNKKGYYERFDGKKYWRKLCIIEGCMKRAKVLSWCKRHYTEEKQKASTNHTQTQQQTPTTSSSASGSTSATTTTTTTSSILPSNLLFHQPHYHQLQAVSQIPLPPPSFLYTSSSISSSPSSSPSSSIHQSSDQTHSLYVRNEIRMNKRGYREQFDGVGHWRPLCVWAQCSKRAKKSAYCKRHFTEQMGHNTIPHNLNGIKKINVNNND